MKKLKERERDEEIEGVPRSLKCEVDHYASAENALYAKASRKRLNREGIDACLVTSMASFQRVLLCLSRTAEYLAKSEMRRMVKTSLPRVLSPSQYTKCDADIAESFMVPVWNVVLRPGTFHEESAHLQRQQVHKSLSRIWHQNGRVPAVVDSNSKE